MQIIRRNIIMHMTSKMKKSFILLYIDSHAVDTVNIIFQFYRLRLFETNPRNDTYSETTLPTVIR